MKTERNRIRFGLAARTSLFVGILVLISAGLVGYVTYTTINSYLVKRELSFLGSESKILSFRFRLLLEGQERSLKFLAGSTGVMGIVRATAQPNGIDPQGGYTLEERHERLVERFTELMKLDPTIEELTFVRAGSESRDIVRTFRRGGGLVTASGDDLLNRQGEAFFKESVVLPRDKVQLSPLQLRREGGEIVTPHEPSITVSMPIQDSEGKTFGVLAAMYNMESTFTALQGGMASAHAFHLLNGKGDFLVHPDPAKAFAFETGRPYRLQDEFPSVKGILTQSEDEPYSGTEDNLNKQRTTLGAFFSQYDSTNPNTRWGILITSPYEIVISGSTAARNTSAGIGGFLIMASIGLGLFATRGVLRQIGGEPAEIEAVTRRVAQGDLDVELGDEGGSSTGIFGSVRAMVKSLRENRDNAAQQDWLKTSVGRLLEISQGVADLPTLARTVVADVAKSMEAGHAAFYVLQQSEEGRGEPLLVLQGSYAYRERKNVSNHIRPGEGLVGQCLVEREPIVLTRVPPNYVQIHSGLGEAAPLNIFVQPILFEGSVMGVLELASFREFTPIQREMLAQAGTNLGVVINGVMSRQRTEELLAESQRLNEEIQAQSEEIQAQSEELRASNEELQEKTRALEDQQMELRASNEELEEKSERLRQQSEELQVVNEELEEKSESIQRQKSEVEKQNAAIEAARRLIEEKANELELASKYKSEFLANMSHELRTPLNSLLILSQTLMDNEEGNLQEEQVESARVIYSSGHDLLSLINDILDLSKIEAGRLNLQLDDVEAGDVLEALRRQFTPVAQKKGLEFRIETGGGVPAKFNVDRMRLDQILKNLLSNAFKFTQQGRVTLKVHVPADTTSLWGEGLKHGQVIAFTIEDTGIGIPESKQRIIFEAFQQADGSTSRNYGGTGLGLTISREMAKLLGGEIHLRSRQGEGSAFTLYLPLDGRAAPVQVLDAPPTPEPPPQANAILQSVPATTEPPPILTPFLPDDRHDLREGDRTMLIIEDDVQFAGVLMNLSHKKGYKCVVAGDGRSGLSCAAQYSPNAIVLDLGLPDMDGLKVLDQIKQNTQTRHIPVHVISGRDDEGVASRKGAVGFLQKPAGLKDIENVFSKIESIIASPIRKILVVEDDEATQRAIGEILHSKDIILTPAMSGTEALSFIRSQVFDCVILDLELGDVSGFELLRTLNRDESLYVLPPVIVYTGRELTIEEHRELTEYSQSIVIKGANSPERLLDEVSLFLHTVESSLSSQRRHAVRMIHEADQALLNRRLLLVDDDLRNTFALSKVLRKHGLEVTLADNGQLALQKLEEDQPFDIILMDIMMPVMDGYETMRRIRADVRFKGLPIIALTAKAMPEDYGKCIEAGANDYLTKPVEVEKLLSMMRVWLFGKKGGPATS